MECEASVSRSVESEGSVTKNGGKDSKICSICGDVAKSQHFGAVSCDSCKAFFRRTVQAENHGNYKCPFEGKCELKVLTRKNCQLCRFKKCLSSGMEPSWVMSEKERKDYNKQLEEKRKIKQSGVHKDGEFMEVASPTSTSVDRPSGEGPDGGYIAIPENIRSFMTEDEESFVKNLVLKYTHSYKMIPYDKKLSSDNDARPNIQTVNMFTTILRRFAYFSMLLPEFSSLPRSDQGMLLRAGILEMCLLRSALCFDIQSNRWPNTNWELYADAPTLRLDDMKRLVTPELYDMHITFIKSMQEMGLDEATCMLLLGITLLSPDRPGLIEKNLVSQSQEKFIQHLEKYVKWRFGPTRGQMIFPRLVTKLADLRGLSDSHNEYNLRLAKQEVRAIQDSLGTLNLEGGMNPYPEFDVMAQAISPTLTAAPHPDVIAQAISPTLTTTPQPFIQSAQNQAQNTFLEREIQTETGRASDSTAATAQQDLEGPERESAMRKQFLMLIQKSMMQVLNNPNLMDMSMNPIDGMNPVNPIPMDESSISIPSHGQQSHFSNQNHSNGQVEQQPFVSGHYISAEKNPLDSIRVLDDHRVRVEVFANETDSYSRHQDLTIPIGQDGLQTDWQSGRAHIRSTEQDQAFHHGVPPEYHMPSNSFTSVQVQETPSSLSVEQLSQFKATMEQLLRCNDTQQLDMVKRVVGNDLFQQVQSKLEQQQQQQFPMHHYPDQGIQNHTHHQYQQQQQQLQPPQQQHPDHYFNYSQTEEQQQEISFHNDSSL